MSNILQSYLVEIGYEIPSGEAGKLQTFLGDADHLIAGHTHGIVKNLLLWQTGIISAFTAVAGGTLGLVEHVATADQAFRLQGERMMMGTQQARALSLALKAVGMSLDEAVWDPEGRHQLEESLELQKNLAAGLGPGFEKNMAQLQELLFTGRSVGTELEYLSYYIVNDLFKAFGATPDLALQKLRALETWFAGSMPEIANSITEELMPVLKDWWNIMRSLEPLLADLGGVFTNFVGILNGDKAIEGTAFSFQKLGHAIGDVAHDFDRFLQFIILSEKMLAHFATAAELLFEGKRKDAVKELYSGLADLTPGSGSVLGAVIEGAAGGAIGGTVLGGPVGTVVGMLGGAAIGAANGALDGNVVGRIKQHFQPTQWDGEDTHWVSDANSSGPGTGKNGPLNWAAAASMGGVPEWLLHAQAQEESGQRQYDKSGNIINSRVGALGVMQLMPKTASDLHVNPYDGQQNLDGGATYIGEMLRRYHGDLDASLAAYNMGPQAYDRAMHEGRSLPVETQKYVSKIEGMAGVQQGQHVNITSMPVTVNVTQPRASHQEMADAMGQGVRKAFRDEALYPLVTQTGVQR